MKQTAEGQPIDIDPFSRPFHGLRREIPLIPAMNRWAIINRPPSGLENQSFRR